MAEPSQAESENIQESQSSDFANKPGPDLTKILSQNESALSNSFS